MVNGRNANVNVNVYSALSTYIEVVKAK